MSKIKQRYSGSIALTKLKHVKMTAKGKSGQVEGIFIPADANYITKGRIQKDEQGNEVKSSEPYYLNIDVLVFNERTDRGQDGMITQKVSSATYKAADETQKEEFKKLPILGNIKDFSNDQPDENSGDAGEGQTFTPADDLPF